MKWGWKLPGFLSFSCWISCLPPRLSALTPAPIRAYSRAYPRFLPHTPAHSRTLPHTPAHSRTLPLSCWCTNIDGRMTKAAACSLDKQILSCKRITNNNHLRSKPELFLLCFRVFRQRSTRGTQIHTMRVKTRRKLGLLTLMSLISIGLFTSFMNRRIMLDDTEMGYQEATTALPFLSPVNSLHSSSSKDLLTVPTPQVNKTEEGSALVYRIDSPKHWVPDWHSGSDTGQVLEARKQQILHR